ncbi:MAG: HAMP domain-containing protein [Anaerolineales bacterium]|nr:HAMP domain-containing protein [Anaerolineales bacterium]
MSILFTLLSSPSYINLPQGMWAKILTGLIWLFILGVEARIITSSRGFTHRWSRRSWVVWMVLVMAVPLTSLFLGVRLPSINLLPSPAVSISDQGSALMVFSFLPWMLAGGLFGATSASILAGFSGLLLAFWETHSPFTPLIYILLAILFCAAINQRYRTFFYKLIRHPLIAIILISLVYVSAFFIETVFVSSGFLASRLDYAIRQLGMAFLTYMGCALVGGVFAEIFALAMPMSWGNRGSLLPSPAEKSLEGRFMYSIAPIAFVLILVQIGVAWFVAEQAARDMLHQRLANTAQVTTESLPFFMETGQSLMAQLVDNEELLTSTPSELTDVLRQYLRSVPYYKQVYMLDAEGNSITGYPERHYPQANSSEDEKEGIQRALDGIPFQMYPIPPTEGQSTAQVAFIAAVFDQYHRVEGVLVGHTDLSTNPFTQPVMNSLENLGEINGEGLLLDEYGRILYHPDANLLMTNYTGQVGHSALFYDETASDGVRRLVYFQPAEGSPWSIVISVPARNAQQLALDIATPILGMILCLSLMGGFFLHIITRQVTRSLYNLADEAANISQGELDRPIQLGREDELGRLRRAFEQMRLSLKARLSELNRLLMVSQGVASSLDISQAVRPVLEAALSTGACSARVVLLPSVIPELEGDGESCLCFSLGPAGESYDLLDDQILEIVRQQDRITLTNLHRPRLLQFPSTFIPPNALLAVALRQENTYYGALWVAFDRAHNFSWEEVHFFITLAGYAALAASNARLFLSAEVGKQRLEAILNSTPDPVLVTDQKGRLLLANPAAWKALGYGMEWEQGQPIERVVTQPELLQLIHSSGEESRPVEVALPDSRVYSATVSNVLAEGAPVGRVCVMRDVSRFKDLDSLKSDFVATVSHDLRSPLTLMQGYATMLELVGQLNEQQVGYVHKILGGVENMSRLVNNLLDLGRIEAGIGLQLEMISAPTVISNVVSNLQLLATQRKVEIRVEMESEELPLLEADPALLQQALFNLIENAVKYTETNGSVEVKTRATDDRMIFEVRDSGVGISPVDQAHLFEKFYRGAQIGTRQARGSGLGLAIVKSIVDRHNGQVWVESQLGIGSTFFLSFPLRQVKRENQ